MGRVRATIVEMDKQKVLHIPSVCLALGIQHAVRLRHVVICDLHRSTTLF